MNKVFDAYGLYYDLLYEDKDYKAEVDYLDQHVQRHKPRAARILELGSGTGMHAALLAARGYTVDGVDQSASMLRRAFERQKKAGREILKRLSFVRGDVRHFRNGKKYDSVVALFHVMSYMSTNNDLQNAFSTAAMHLDPEGIFIFDCWYGPGVLYDKPEVRKKQLEDADTTIERVSTPSLNEETHTVDVHFDISVTDKTSNVTSYLEETHRMRYLFTEELQALARTAGFDIIHAEEWLSGKPLTESSWNALYVCKLVSRKHD